MYNYLLIDGNNIFHRYWSIFKKNHKPKNTKKILSEPMENFILGLDNLENKFLKKNGLLYVLFDNIDSKENYRKTIDPNYKQNREKKSDSFYHCIEYIQLFLLSYKNNIRLVYRQNTEADDLVLPIIQRLPKNESKLIISNDLDWARCLEISDNIFWYKNKMVYDKKRFKQEYGYDITNKSIVMYKAFRGDDSDNIPNAVPYLKEKDLLNIINNYHTIEEVIYNIKSLPINEKWKNKILENKARLKLNYKLVDFINISDKGLDECLYTCKFEKKMLEKYFKNFNFKRLHDPRLNLKEEKKSFDFCFDKTKRG